MTVNCKECEELKSILRSIIDILCEYSLIHTDMPINHLKTDVSKIHAMTLDDKRIIYICRDQGHYSKRISVLHELKHAEHFIGSDYDEFQRKSNKEFEKQIGKEADEFFLRLYPQKGGNLIGKKEKKKNVKRSDKKGSQDRKGHLKESQENEIV